MNKTKIDINKKFQTKNTLRNAIEAKKAIFTIIDIAAIFFIFTKKYDV